MRITINGQKVVTSVNLKVYPKVNAVARKSTDSIRKDYELNTRLDQEVPINNL